MSEVTAKSKAKESLVRELFKLGAHFSFSRARRHPSAEGFIFGYKNRHAVIDLEKTVEAMDKAKSFVKDVAASGGSILLVGSKNEAREAVKSAALKLDMPYVALRWVGGTLTNFKNIRKRIDRLAEIEGAEKSGELEAKYTKKERAVIDKEKQNLTRLFASLSGLTKLPQAMIVIDAGEETMAVTEANKVGLPVVSLSGTDCDLRNVAYPVVANDTSAPTIRWFVEEVVSAYNEGKVLAKEKESAKEETKETNNDNNGAN